MKSNHLDAALEYARRGWAVFPCKPRAKTPLTEHGFLDATTDAEQIRKWWQQHPSANIGIAAGASGLVDVDLDSPEALAWWKQQSYANISTPTQRTRPGRWQLFFADTTGGAIRNSESKLAHGVDIRANGGYSVVPPSVHPTGSVYEWVDGKSPDKLPLAPLPQELAQLLMQLNAASASNGKTPPRDAVTEREVIPEGRRNGTLTSLAGSMRKRGMTPDAICAALIAENALRCLPPLPEDEVRRIAESVARYEPAQRWESLVSFEAPNLPPFPTAALPGWLREFVEAESIATQTPLDLPGMLSLSVLGTAAAKRGVVRIRDGWQEPLNCYTITAQPPGSRKSAVFADLAAPLMQFEAEEARRLGPEIAEARTRYDILVRECERAKQMAVKAKPEERDGLKQEACRLARQCAEVRLVEVPRLIVDDCTAERLASLLSVHGGRMALLSAEGGVFDLIAGRYSANSAPNLNVFLMGHAGDTLRVDRVGREPDFVNEPAVTIGLTVQPDVIRGLADKPGFRGRGLLARFWYSLPASIMGHRAVNAPPLPGNIRAAYQCHVTALLNMPAGTDSEGNECPHVIRLTPEASTQFVNFEKWLEPQLGEFGELGALADWAGKLAGAVARIAGQLHLARYAGGEAPWTRPIDEATMASALRVGKYLIDHARAAFGLMGAVAEVEDARHVLAWFKRTRTEGFTQREAWQGTKGRFERVARLASAFRLLEERGYIRRSPMPERDGVGRPPSQNFDVNPWVFQRESSPHNPHNDQNCRTGRYCGDCGEGSEAQEHLSSNSYDNNTPPGSLESVKQQWLDTYRAWRAAEVSGDDGRMADTFEAWEARDAELRATMPPDDYSAWTAQIEGDLPDEVIG